MGVKIHTQEITSPVAPSRLFKALTVDSHNFIPKLMPGAVKRIDLLEGDGRAGTLKDIYFPDDRFYRYKTEALDEEKLTCRNALLQGHILPGKGNFIVYEFKFEESGDGGSIIKITNEYHSEGETEFSEEIIQANLDAGMEMYKAVDAYLLSNPSLYA